MANSQFGTKRICPETGRKFYDLNKDPIVSPYTGKTYPLTFFEANGSDVVEEEEETEAAELGSENEDVEVVSLEDAEEGDSNAKSSDDPDVDLEDDDDVDLGDDDDDDTFLEDEEEDDDVTGIIDVDDDEEES
ncbi:MAG: TIGR02300 family protein [Rhizobiaceae bacterium]|nr:TIGR02300 family protein [Rhizobiaceae bacterium]